MTATSRTSKIVSDSQGEQVHHLYGGPVFYKDKSGNYKDIDMTHSDASSSIGNIILREKHSSSVGIRKDNSKTKYLGIRPDETQEDGTNQMEWSIVNVEFDGVSQDIDLSKNDIDRNIVDLGDVVIENTKLFTRQLVKYNGTATDFKIEFDIHLKNMSITNDKYDGSYEFRKPCALDITDMGEDTGKNVWEYHILNPLESTDAKNINVIIGKITDNHIMTSSLDKSEEFSDISLSGYTTTAMENINSSMYMKDTICMCFQNQNLSLDFYDYVVKRLCKMWNCTITELAYFTDSNGKKFGSCIEDSLGRVFVFINTKEISNTIKDLFLRKDFSSTGYLDVTIDDVKASLNAYFKYTHSSVPVDNSYYKPKDSGLFVVDNGNNGKYTIPYPVVLDNEFAPLNIETYHTLKDNGDGTYRYTKYLTQESIMQELLLDSTYIDGTTNIENNTEGVVQEQHDGNSSSATSTDWDNVQKQQTGTLITANASVYIYGQSAGYAHGVETYEYTRLVGSGYGVTTYRGYINKQLQFRFNTSSITDTVTSAKFYIAGGWQTVGGITGGETSFIIVKGRDVGSDGSITAADYGALDGISDGGAFVEASLTPYTAEINWSDQFSTTAFSPIYSDIAYGNWTLLSAIHNDIKNDSTVYLHLMDHDNSYKDTRTGVGTNRGNKWTYEGYNWRGWIYGSGYHSCAAAGSAAGSGIHPPYLEVTTGAAPAVTNNSVFFGANF